MTRITKSRAPPGSTWRPKTYPQPNPLDLLQVRLRERKIKFDDTWSDDKLEELEQRWNRGMLPYTNCSFKELEIFCKQRGLSTKVKKGKGKKAVFVERLERADDEPKFERFLELPPELRTVVYEIVLLLGDDQECEVSDVRGTLDEDSGEEDGGEEEDVGDQESIPHIDPICSQRQATKLLPLAQSCSQTRKEALPVFYAINTFGPFWALEMEATHSWMSQVVAENVCHVGHLLLRAANRDCSDDSEEMCAMLLLVDFSRDGVAVRHHVNKWNGEGCPRCATGVVAVAEVKEVCSKYASDCEEVPQLSWALLEELMELSCGNVTW